MDQLANKKLVRTGREQAAMHLIPTILCGGAGSRLWPVSRDSLHDPANCYIKGNKRPVGALATQNPVVADTPDAPLVADKSRAQDVKYLHAKLKASWIVVGGMAKLVDGEHGLFSLHSILKFEIYKSYLCVDGTREIFNSRDAKVIGQILRENHQDNCLDTLEQRTQRIASEVRKTLEKTDSPRAFRS